MGGILAENVNLSRNTNAFLNNVSALLCTEYWIAAINNYERLSGSRKNTRHGSFLRNRSIICHPTDRCQRLLLLTYPKFPLPHPVPTTSPRNIFKHYCFPRQIRISRTGCFGDNFSCPHVKLLSVILNVRWLMNTSTMLISFHGEKNEQTTISINPQALRPHFFFYNCNILIKIINVFKKKRDVCVMCTR